MEVSVIVPTCDRAASLDRLLHDLTGQKTDATFEILAVDNRSTDGTADVIRRHRRRDRRVRYLFERRAGASCARNAGIAAAAAPIVAFIDDDVRPRADWVDAIVAAFKRHPEVDCIGGRVEPQWPYPPPRWLTRAHWSPLALQIDRGRSRYIDRDHASSCLISANFACRAEVFRQLGGFAREYRRDEDRELNLRMWRAGKRGMFVDAVVAAAQIQPERLQKRYHRQWYHVTGASHARMRFRDAIAHDGRLKEEALTGGRVWLGVPAFLYREAIGVAAMWIGHALTGARAAAFLDECRLRYFASYFVGRWRDQRAEADAFRVKLIAT